MIFKPICKADMDSKFWDKKLGHSSMFSVKSLRSIYCINQKFKAQSQLKMEVFGDSIWGLVSLFLYNR